jgi:hypothetical protein
MTGEPLRLALSNGAFPRASPPHPEGSSLLAAVRRHAGAKPRGGGGGAAGKSAWLAPDGSKRWGEKFFLLYTPFWLTLCLGVVVPFKLYEVYSRSRPSPSARSAFPVDPRTDILDPKTRFDLRYLSCSDWISSFFLLSILGFVLVGL